MRKLIKITDIAKIILLFIGLGCLFVCSFVVYLAILRIIASISMSAFIAVLIFQNELFRNELYETARQRDYYKQAVITKDLPINKYHKD